MDTELTKLDIIMAVGVVVAALIAFVSTYNDKRQ